MNFFIVLPFFLWYLTNAEYMINRRPVASKTTLMIPVNFLQVLHYVLFVFAVSFINGFKNLYVIVILLNVVLAELFVQPLNHTVVFLKETEIICTSDTWRIALNSDLSTCHEIISTIIEQTYFQLNSRRKSLLRFLN